MNIEKKKGVETKKSTLGTKIAVGAAALAAIATLAYTQLPKRKITESSTFGQKFWINYADKIPVAADVYTHSHTIRDGWRLDNAYFGKADDQEVIISDEWDVTYGYEYQDIIHKHIEIVEDEDGRTVSFLNLDMPDTLRVVLTNNCEITSSTNEMQNALNEFMRAFTRWNTEDMLEKARSEKQRRSGIHASFLEHFANNTEKVLAKTTDKLYADFVRNSELMWVKKTDLFVATYNIDGSRYVYNNKGDGSKMVEYTPATVEIR